MTDNNEQKKDVLQVARPSKLSLTKTVESGKVKQNFQHGRSKTVTVEVRKTRTFTSNDSGAMVEVKKNATTPAPEKPVVTVRQPDLGEDERSLTDDERQTRLRVLKHAEEQARVDAEQQRLREAEDNQRRSELEATATADGSATSSAASAPRKSHIVVPRVEAKPDAVEVKRPATAETEEDKSKAVRKDIVTPVKVRTPEEEAEAKPSKIRLKRDEGRRNSGKLTVTQALGIHEERVRSLASIRRQREKAHKKGDAGGGQERIIREVVVPEIITVQELANRMAVRAVDVVKTLMKMGTMVTMNQTIDADTAELIVSEFGHTIKRVTEGDVENILREVVEDDENLKFRAPVVTIMGHVDHGKTSLLDALRATDVVAGEAGGITQHIGAYQVEMKSGDKITFLDTPGHEAFTAMRARGAKSTDIVVLVVAADDGIMAQTKEAISHAKAAGVPIIVAINKIDKPGADPARVKNELISHELVCEEFGGDVMVVEVSAKQKIGLDKLEEIILLQAEVLELRANPARSAAGVVIEAKMDKGRGAIATLLVQRGTINVGDILVAGAAHGKVRALIDDKGRMLSSAGPSQPVEILGLNQAPTAGDEFAVVESEKTAREITEYRSKKERSALSVLSTRTMEQMFAAAGKDAVKELPVIVKADVQGSAEAIIGSLMKFSNDEVSVKVIFSGVGGISESDVTLAQTTGAIIIGFNVRAGAQARDHAAREKIDIRYYSIIYDVVDDIKAALSGMLSPTLKEKFLGNADIREVFNISKFGKIAGCMVTEGMVKRGAKVRLLRDNVVIHEGTLKTLRRFKDDVKEVKSGFECGMAFENYEDIRPGDTIEAFEIEEVARSV